MKLKISKIYVYIVVLKVKVQKNSPKRKKKEGGKRALKKKRPPNWKKKGGRAQKKKTAGAFGGRFFAPSFLISLVTIVRVLG